MNHKKEKTMKLASAIDLRNNELTAADLLLLARIMYPGVDDPELYGGPYPHPVNAIAVVLMSAALIGTIDTGRLKRFTGYSRAFISAIKVNMENNHLWSRGRYDASAWLSSKGAIDHNRLFEHVEFAMGWVWKYEVDSDDSTEPCEIYWDEYYAPVITIPARAEKGPRKMRYHD